MFSKKIFFFHIIFFLIQVILIHSSESNQNFTCENKGFGFYADTFNNCQTYHICEPRIENSQVLYTKNSFSCSTGTVFDQKTLSCVHLTSEFICSDSIKYYNQTKVISNKPTLIENTDKITNLKPKLNKKINSTIINANFLALNNSKEIFFDNKKNVDKQLKKNTINNSTLINNSLINSQNKFQKPKLEEKVQKPKNEGKNFEKILKPKLEEKITVNQNLNNSEPKNEKLNNKYSAIQVPKFDEKILNLNNRLNYDSNTLNLRRIQIGRRIYYVFKNPRP